MRSAGGICRGNGRGGRGGGCESRRRSGQHRRQQRVGPLHLRQPQHRHPIQRTSPDPDHEEPSNRSSPTTNFSLSAFSFFNVLYFLAYRQGLAGDNLYSGPRPPKLMILDSNFWSGFRSTSVGPRTISCRGVAGR